MKLNESIFEVTTISEMFDALKNIIDEFGDMPIASHEPHRNLRGHEINPYSGFVFREIYVAPETYLREDGKEDNECRLSAFRLWPEDRPDTTVTPAKAEKLMLLGNQEDLKKISKEINEALEDKEVK
jgi:hypothetical protein